MFSLLFPSIQHPASLAFPCHPLLSLTPSSPLICRHFFISLSRLLVCPLSFSITPPPPPPPVLSLDTQQQFMPMRMLVIVKWKCKVEGQWIIRKEFCQWNKCSLDQEHPAAINDFTRLLTISLSVSRCLSLSAFSFKEPYWHDCFTHLISKTSIQMKNSADKRCQCH